jgi:hypothetical protein
MALCGVQRRALRFEGAVWGSHVPAVVGVLAAQSVLLSAGLLGAQRVRMG